MAINERRLTGRDVLAKTFQRRTKRGYDPVEVDAYLELVAAQIDMLHGDVGRAAQEASTSSPGPEVLTPTPIAVDESAIAERDALADQLEALGEDHAALHASAVSLEAEKEALAAQNADLVAANEALVEQHQMLAAENDQLKAQLTAVAPPPPGENAEASMGDAPLLPDPPVADPVETPLVESEPAAPTLVAEESLEVAADERASEESYELVLRMARRSAEETIAEAHARADEIVADANFTASQISRESDRKAFEAANQVQAELSSLTEQIESRKAELRHLDGRAAEKRTEMRELASRILLLADDIPRPHEGVEVVDLRTTSADA